MEKQTKRPIDLLRDGAGHLRIGEDGDESPITGFLKSPTNLFVLKAHAIYEIKMADDIDPERKNISVPNVHQKILAFGSDDFIVGRTVQTADSLLKEGYLEERINIALAKTGCFNGLRHLAAMRRSADLMKENEKDCMTSVRSAQGGALALPSMGDIHSAAAAFIQNCDHALQKLLDVVECFYGAVARRAWFESFRDLTRNKYGEDDGLAKLCEESLPFLQFIRKARNCVEHEKPHEKLIVSDFSLSPSMELARPSIEVIHPKYPQEAMPLVDFMSEVCDHIADLFADFLAGMCIKHLVPLGAVPIAIGPNDQPRDEEKHVKYRYFVEMNGGWAPLS